MSNIYTWSIDSLDFEKSLDGQSNVVSNIHWRVIATDNATPIPNVASIYGSQLLPFNSSNQFIDYSELNEQIVIGWLQNLLGQDEINAIQSNLDIQINNLTKSAKTNLGLPW